MLKWGILGTGAIAKKFAEGLPLCRSGELVAVGSRDLARAEHFCSEFGGRAMGDYAAVLDDPAVEAVYISLPHHMHAEWTIRAAEAGKHILCEKPFVLTRDEAVQCIEAVEKAGVFFMEAFMYRVHPQTLTVHELLQNGVIGQPKTMHAEFGYTSQRAADAFRFDGSVGGGALMDVGCYPISLARFVAGCEPNQASYSAELATSADGHSKYDAYGTGELIFPTGFRTTFQCGMHVQMNNWATIFGELGRIHITSPWFCNGPLFVQLNGKEPEPISVKAVPHLWGNQSVVVDQLLARKQAPFMSWKDSVAQASILERLRLAAGIG
ncbi:MAG: Gfo/Idh/MocA family oxidoreductase [Chthonomonas sp.]|nr:Gfo/Idh/MocA family oxidoreductase [Chthonomonas sp.]